MDFGDVLDRELVFLISEVIRTSKLMGQAVLADPPAPRSSSA
jgi:hypothetical protein